MSSKPTADPFDPNGVVVETVRAHSRFFAGNGGD